MDARLTALLGHMLTAGATTPGLPIIDAATWLADDADPMARVSAAFLVVAAGPTHPQHECALGILAEPPPAADTLAAFYAQGLERIGDEWAGGLSEGTAARWDEAIEALAAATSADDVAEAIWQAFFPQAVGIRGHEQERIDELRARRTISVRICGETSITTRFQSVSYCIRI